MSESPSQQTGQLGQNRLIRGKNNLHPSPAGGEGSACCGIAHMDPGFQVTKEETQLELELPVCRPSEENSGICM